MRTDCLSRRLRLRKRIHDSKKNRYRPLSPITFPYDFMYEYDHELIENWSGMRIEYAARCEALDELIVAVQAAGELNAEWLEKIDSFSETPSVTTQERVASLLRAAEVDGAHELAADLDVQVAAARGRVSEALDRQIIVLRSDLSEQLDRSADGYSARGRVYADRWFDQSCRSSSAVESRKQDGALHRLRQRDDRTRCFSS